MPSIWLMYHDVYPEEPTPGVPRSSAMYHLSKETFLHHLRAIKASGLRVLTASESINAFEGDSVVLTFDDGWRGAFETALPLLQAFDFKATYFLTKDFVGCPGFCDRDLIVTAARAGMELGVHGTTHRMLSSCSRDEIVWEFATCKQFLESLLGEQVVSASMPSGDWNAEIVSCARETGLDVLCTSRPGINTPKTSFFKLRRMAIREATSAFDVQRYCTFDVRKEMVRWAAYQAPRRMLGMKRYALLRRWMLGERDGATGEVFKP